MSELKSHNTKYEQVLGEVYLKTEVDQYIAELKQKLDDYRYTIAVLRKEKSHQKYKRCLAMAKWCERERIEAANYRIPREKWEFYEKWHKRWLELAEKFKEAK